MHCSSAGLASGSAASLPAFDSPECPGWRGIWPAGRAGPLAWCYRATRVAFVGRSAVGSVCWRIVKPSPWRRWNSSFGKRVGF
ncbi:hypothetical protein VITFI_CDS0265 [Vitreoscilla filiformis]|uniref:Uncharacterized protein n=1 Tax=Vitreoscilla filiformis TaxID=63 RepID=A0A221KAI0_VITFI|nr:hypothetical protein VITFI_CDS0265 [Vitreoscilla filiformis]